MAHMGIGMASGDKRAAEAARQAVASPLLETTINGAKGVLINITGGSDMSLSEAAEASDIITETADPNANIIWGADIDDEMGDSIRITVIATGFESVSEYEEEASPAPAQGVKLPGVNRTGQRTAKQNGLGNSFEDWETGKEVNYTAPRKNRAEYSSPLPEGEEVTPHFTKQDLPRDYDPHERNNLDLPSFLRNQKK